MIIDDPIKADAVDSEAARLQALNWFQSSFATRGDDKLGGAQILVMQRLHEEDLGGYLVGEGWPALSLPAINDADRSIPISRSRSYHWKSGELLHPAREPIEVLNELRRILGPRRFSAQYLQNPLPVRGNLILAEWLKTYEGSPDDIAGGQVIQSWDPAASEEGNACYSACVTARRIGNVFYILDVHRGRYGFTALREKVIALSQRWRPEAILMEYSSNGIGLFDDLRGRTVPGLASLVKVSPGSQSKFERMDEQAYRIFVPIKEL